MLTLVSAPRLIARPAAGFRNTESAALKKALLSPLTVNLEPDTSVPANEYTEPENVDADTTESVSDTLAPQQPTLNDVVVALEENNEMPRL